MGAFSVASVLGVPLGLELARRGGWRLPFFAVAGLGLLVTVAATALMPPMTRHLATRATPVRFGFADLGARGAGTRAVRLALAAVGSSFLASFALVPNLSAYLQLNWRFPRAQLGYLYLAGGTVTFFSMRAAGWLVDRHGSPRVAAGATALYVAVLLALGFAVGAVPVPALFVGFMLANSTRNVAAGALTTRVPAPEERARYMSAQSATQHLAASAGAVVSSQLLRLHPDGSLAGMGVVAALAAALALLLPALLLPLQRAVGAATASPQGRPRGSTVPEPDAL
jgi:predicted MFS family arabinose efflux permease